MLSKQLKDKGYPQGNSHMYWHHCKVWPQDKQEHKNISKLERHWEGFAAPTVDELGEVLKDKMISWYNPRLEKWACAQEYSDDLRLYADTEADARAGMWLYLKENNLL